MKWRGDGWVGGGRREIEMDEKEGMDGWVEEEER